MFFINRHRTTGKDSSLFAHSYIASTKHNNIIDGIKDDNTSKNNTKEKTSSTIFYDDMWKYDITEDAKHFSINLAKSWSLCSNASRANEVSLTTTTPKRLESVEELEKRNQESINDCNYIREKLNSQSKEVKSKEECFSNKKKNTKHKSITFLAHSNSSTMNCSTISINNNSNTVRSLSLPRKDVLHNNKETFVCHNTSGCNNKANALVESEGSDCRCKNKDDDTNKKYDDDKIRKQPLVLLQKEEEVKECAIKPTKYTFAKTLSTEPSAVLLQTSSSSNRHTISNNDMTLLDSSSNDTKLLTKNGKDNDKDKIRKYKHKTIAVSETPQQEKELYEMHNINKNSHKHYNTNHNNTTAIDFKDTNNGNITTTSESVQYVAANTSPSCKEEEMIIIPTLWKRENDSDEDGSFTNKSFHSNKNSNKSKKRNCYDHSFDQNTCVESKESMEINEKQSGCDDSINLPLTLSIYSCRTNSSQESLLELSQTLTPNAHLPNYSETIEENSNSFLECASNESSLAVQSSRQSLSQLSSSSLALQVPTTLLLEPSSELNQEHNVYAQSLEQTTYKRAMRHCELDKKACEVESEENTKKMHTHVHKNVEEQECNLLETCLPFKDDLLHYNEEYRLPESIKNLSLATEQNSLSALPLDCTVMKDVNTFDKATAKTINNKKSNNNFDVYTQRTLAKEYGKYGVRELNVSQLITTHEETK